MEGSSGEMRSSSLFRAGALAFTVDSTDEDLIDIAERLFHDLREGGPSERRTERFELCRSDDAGDERFDLSGPAVGLMTGITLPRALMWLVSGLSRAALDAEPERLHLHAAAAARGGRAAVLAAPRETGKTSTVARMALAGWTYLSDEAVSIGPGDACLRGFPKPLSIKPGGRDLMPELRPHLLPQSAPADAVLHSPLGPLGVEVCDASTAHLIAILHRPTEHSAVAPPSEVLHPVDAVVALLSDTMDAGRFGDTSVVELAELAARCWCHRVAVLEPSATIAEIERLFDQPPATPLEVETLRGGTSTNPAVLTVRVGDRVVLHEQPEGRIVALDAAASTIWMALGGWRRAVDVDLGAPVVAQFIDTLVGLGFVVDRSGVR